MQIILLALTLILSQTVTVRLLDPISSIHSKVGDPVRAVMISPPTGVQIQGTVTEVKRIEGKRKAAEMRVEFDQPQRAMIVDVDNGRETVADDGKILGMPLLRVKPSKTEDLLLLAAYAHPIALGVLAVTDIARRETDKPEISYPQGTELVLNWKGPIPEGPIEPPPSLADEAEISELVQQMPARTSTHNGTISDFTNLVFIGERNQIDSAFLEAGWLPAERLSIRAMAQAFFAIAQHYSYKEAPVSALYLGGRSADMVFQKQNDTFAKRHHLRIWRMPQTFHGKPVWLASATHDIGIEFSRQAKNFSHRIDSQIDRERQKVVDDFVFAGRAASVGCIARPRVPKSGQNATGGKIETDGAVAVLVLK